MAFVQRRDGAICGLYANAQPGYAEEKLPDDDPEVAAFRAKASAMFLGADGAPTFLARNLFELLTVDDFTRIKAATAQSDALGLLWASLQAQGDAPIRTDKPRFIQGWAGMKAALGDVRCAELATALGFKS